MHGLSNKKLRFVRSEVTLTRLRSRLWGFNGVIQHGFDHQLLLATEHRCKINSRISKQTLPYCLLSQKFCIDSLTQLIVQQIFVCGVQSHTIDPSHRGNSGHGFVRGSRLGATTAATATTGCSF